MEIIVAARIAAMVGRPRGASAISNPSDRHGPPPVAGPGPTLDDMAAIQWGEVPAYIGALLTGGGVGVAAWNVWRAVNDARGAAARKVWAMLPTKDMFAEDWDGPGDQCWAVVHNGSDEPMFNCVLTRLNWEWRKDRRELCNRSFACITPNKDSEPVPIGPLEKREWQPGQENLVPMEITFTDGRGQRWHRAPDAGLRRI